MTEPINIERFLATGDERRAYLHRPFSDEHYTYATNGHIAIRVPYRAECDGFAPDDTVAAMQRMFAKALAVPLIPMPTIDLPAAQLPSCRACKGLGFGALCMGCSGSGEHDCDCEYCETECDLCDGHGLVKAEYDDDKVQCARCLGSGYDRRDDGHVWLADDVTLDAHYLAMMLALPGPLSVSARRRYLGDHLRVIAIAFDGGHALIMPCKRGADGAGVIHLEDISIFAPEPVA